MNPYSNEYAKTNKTRRGVAAPAVTTQTDLFSLDTQDIAAAPPVTYEATRTPATNADTVTDQTPALPPPTVSDQTTPPAAPAAAAVSYTRPAVLTTKGAVSLEVAAVRDIAMDIGEGGISDRLKAELQDAILEVAAMKALFITADVKEHLGPRYTAIPDPRVIGPVMKGMQKLGLIKPTAQMIPSTDPANHGRYMRVWTMGENGQQAIRANQT